MVIQMPQLLQTLTIMPNVQAVSPSLTIAVSTNKNTFSHIAVGLSANKWVLREANAINPLA